MKEVVAVLRYEKAHPTRDALRAIGFDFLIQHAVQGRGKQRGLRYARRPGGIGDGEMPFLPKRLLTGVFEDSDVPIVIQTLIRLNQTGNPGDGKIFVRPLVCLTADEPVHEREAVPVALR